MKKILFAMLFLVTLSIKAQEYFPANTGVKTTETNTVAFINAKIFVTPTQIIENGTLLIKDEKVINVGVSVSIPKNAEIIDLKGKSIYPSFIDLYTSFGIEAPKRVRNTSAAPQYDAGREGYYWNDHIRPETNPIAVFEFNKKQAEALLKEGFGVVNTHLQDGIIRGNGLLIALNPNVTDSYRILDTKSAQYLSFKKSAQSNQIYPNSLMGAMALIRQAYYDAEWYSKGLAKNKDLSLEALNNNKNLVQIFEAEGKQNNLRADKVGDEFGIQYVIVGGGDEYENIEEIKATNATYIIPVNFRKAYDVSEPYMADEIALGDLRKWNQEPANLQILQKNKVPFSLTTNQLKVISDFNKNLQKAFDYGFDKTTALEALTTVPAKILGKSNEIGSLKKGSYANFLITSGELFDKETTLYENWVQGSKNTVNSMAVKEISGDYELSLNAKNYDLSITGKSDKSKVAVKDGETKLKSKLIYKDNWLNLMINSQTDSTKFNRLIARVYSNSDNLSGTAIDEKGVESTWNAIKKTTSKEKEKEKKEAVEKIIIIPVTYPNIAFGFTEKPKQETILFKNSTVWTGENEGVLKNTDVLITAGKISKIGINLTAKDAKIIDGTGKHLTAGIVDEHSHIATVAVNEAGQNSTAEVSLEDVIDSDDIQIYRSLAGGVSTVQILHGSANPIGGQAALVKLKWGETANNLLYKNNDKFIKFALGENVKQSNWGNTETVRFPQTRMGVEEVYTDYFQRAKEYDAIKKSGKPFRKDSEMEILGQILNKERFITCHSYVQSEINMLMKVADKFNFTVNTFTHILEGYKVADKMKAHGAGASTFSDWWAYKYEVNDAIPYNAAIMHNVGITVAINSDDAEMNRRLNQEAAKTIKYGRLSEEEAWKLVTINPAKLLHIDARVGSIKVGKDADVVLWSDNPLSIYAKAEKTLVEGVIYFDIERDLQLREQIKNERNSLINMMLIEKNNGNDVQPPTKKTPVHFHCDTVLD
ncbi:amidohydrolase family protein [Lutibacter sp.]|uniref:amidohydrolase family protein n=1 Tax=Lutibacter sp. TaxID=1925666 RepID=UPI003563D71F